MVFGGGGGDIYINCTQTKCYFRWDLLRFRHTVFIGPNEIYIVRKEWGVWGGSRATCGIGEIGWIYIALGRWDMSGRFCCVSIFLLSAARKSNLQIGATCEYWGVVGCYNLFCLHEIGALEKRDVNRRASIPIRDSLWGNISLCDEN